MPTKIKYVSGHAQGLYVSHFVISLASLKIYIHSLIYWESLSKFSVSFLVCLTITSFRFHTARFTYLLSFRPSAVPDVDHLRRTLEYDWSKQGHLPTASNQETPAIQTLQSVAANASCGPLREKDVDGLLLFEACIQTNNVFIAGLHGMKAERQERHQWERLPQPTTVAQRWTRFVQT